VIRRLGLIAVAAAAFLVLIVIRDIPNSDYEPARGYVEEMEAAYRSVEEGTVSLDAVTGFATGEFIVDRPILGGTVEDDVAYSVVVGEHGGRCYVIRWQPGRAPFIGRLSQDLECAPSLVLLSRALTVYDDVAIHTDVDRPIDWDPIIPPAIEHRVWFLPAVLALLIVVIQSLVSLSLVGVRRGVPTAAVIVEEGAPASADLPATPPGESAVAEPR